MEKHPEITIPVIAVGGVGLADVEHLRETWIYGIAVSAAVNMAVDPGEALKAFNRKIY